LQKKCELLEEILKELQAKYVNLEKENADIKKENSLLNTKCNEFRDEFSKMKKFFNEIQPVLKIEWQDISSENIKSQQNLTLNEQSDFSNHNIVKLIENMKEFLVNYQNKIQLNLNSSSEGVNLELVFPIIENIQKYLVVLLRKVQHLTLNQYHIINICCDLNEKIQVSY
jgi:predicted nuclease with TOPRIM domain